MKAGTKGEGSSLVIQTVALAVRTCCVRIRLVSVYQCVLKIYWKSIRLAQGNDPTFEAARYAFEAAQEKIPQARAGLFPTIKLNGNDNGTHASSQFTIQLPAQRGESRRAAWTWTLQLTQPLLRPQNINAYRESESLVEQARAQYSQAEQDLILRVTQAYFDVLVAQESIEVADAQVKATGEQLALTQRGFEAGTNAITDVHEAKSRSDLARAQRIAAQNELEAKQAELEKLVGQPSH